MLLGQGYREVLQGVQERVARRCFRECKKVLPGIKQYKLPGVVRVARAGLKVASVGTLPR